MMGNRWQDAIFPYEVLSGAYSRPFCKTRFVQMQLSDDVFNLLCVLAKKHTALKSKG